MKLQLNTILNALSVSGPVIFPAKKSDNTKAYKKNSIDF